MTCASVLQGRADNSFDVMLGIIELTSSPSGSTSRRSSTVVPHPGFNLATRINDIGLIQLAGVSSVSYNDFIQPIFFEGIRSEVPVTAVVSGWGSTTNEVGAVSNNLLMLQRTTLSNEACEAVQQITRDNICTSNTDGAGFCTTGIGSPLVSGLQLIGIASWVESCGSTRPVSLNERFSINLLLKIQFFYHPECIHKTVVVSHMDWKYYWNLKIKLCEIEIFE